MSKVIKEFKKINRDDFGQWFIKTEDDQEFVVIHKDSVLKIRDRLKLGKILHQESTFGRDYTINTKVVKQKLKFNGFTFQTEKTYDVDYKNFKDDPTAESFQHWWNEEGSLFTPEENEDPEEFTKRICGIAWNNGGFKGGEDER